VAPTVGGPDRRGPTGTRERSPARRSRLRGEDTSRREPAQGGVFLGGCVWSWWIYSKFVAVLSGIEIVSLDPVSLATLSVSAAGLAVTHVVSYRQNYVGDGEHRRATTNSLLVELFLHLAPLILSDTST
jgi:hypothetical protein